MRMKNVIAMDKANIQVIYDAQVRASNLAFEFIIELFERTGADVMTRAEIIEKIKDYQVVLNEELKIERP